MSQKLIVDCSTGEKTLVDYTAEEEASALAAQEAQLAQNVINEAAATQAATEKASANTKLKALGLTDAEIAALVG
jgi:outer membrane murein-binding lipoprotein Lpp